MIEFECPACDAVIRVGENAVGKKGRCPKCQTLLLVPDPDDFEDEEEPDSPPETVSDSESELESEPIAPLEPPPVPEHSPEPGPEFESPPVPEPEPEPVIIVTEPPIDAPTEPASPAVAEETPEEPVPPAAPPYDPDNPFAFATGSSAVSRATSGRSHRRRGRGSSRSTMPIVAVLAGVFILLVGGGLLYLMLRPDLSGELIGERFEEVELPAVTFAGPTKDYPAVRDVLTNEGLPLKSEYISVTIDAADGRPRVLVEPGPQAVPVRVAFGSHEGVQGALASKREQIAKIKQQELTTATANLYRDYDAYLEEGTSMSKLPEYRNQVALNATVGPVGYAIEARVSGYPFPCVYEDSDGNCYFFLPTGVQTFQLRGRQLLDGSTPLPVEIDVTLKDAVSPKVTSQKPETSKEEKRPEPKETPEKDKTMSDDAPKSDDTMKDEETDGATKKEGSMEGNGKAEE